MERYAVPTNHVASRTFSQQNVSFMMTRKKIIEPFLCIVPCMKTIHVVACRAALFALFVSCCSGSNQRSLSLFDPPEFHLPPHPPGAALMSDKFTELPLSAYGDYPSPLTPGSVLMLNTHFQETALPAFVEWPQSQDVLFQHQSFTWEVWVYPFPNQAIGCSIIGNLFVGPLLPPLSTHV